MKKKKPVKIKNEIKNILNFLIESGKLKKIKRSGWVFRGVKNPETIAGHSFRMALMAWLLAGKKRLNIEKIIKMALLHDLCEVYAGDATPYDKIILTDKALLKNLLTSKKRRKEFFEKWPRFSQKEKEEQYLEKFKKESQALKKLTAKLPSQLKKEMKSLWLDYENGSTKEGRFLRQVDRVENMLQAYEYQKEDRHIPIRAFYIQLKELIDDQILLEFIKELEKKFGRV